MPRRYDATIVIVTKNRRDELRGAIASALEQTAAVEVLVIDDGSTDGTAEIVRREFPTARLHVSTESRGYIAQRNLAARLARSPILVSIDDDAFFPSPETVAQTLAEFEHPCIGAVAIPFINVRQDATVQQQAPEAGGIWVADRFIGTAHALRRDVFLQLGGYRECWIHQGEEGDYSLRMLDAGYFVRLGSAPAIHHLESPRRDFRRMDHYGRRNDILFASHNVPMPALVPHLAGTTLKGLAFALRTGRPRAMIAGLFQGWIDAARCWPTRRPVTRAAYRLSRRLKHRGPLRLEEIAPVRIVESGAACW